jgi:hypothetical protein
LGVPRYVSFPTEGAPERGYGSRHAGAGSILGLTTSGIPLQRGEEVPQYKYRGHIISISAASAGDAVKVDTKIFLRPDASLGVTSKLRASTLQIVSVGPPHGLLKEALETAKHTADVVAEQALGLKTRARR